MSTVTMVSRWTTALACRGPALLSLFPPLHAQRQQYCASLFPYLTPLRVPVTLAFVPNCIVKRGRADLVVPMCPQLKLMQLVYSYKQEGLSDIDLVLFSGVFMFDAEANGGIEKLSVEAKEAVLHGLFFAINWFREVCDGDTVQACRAQRFTVITLTCHPDPAHPATRSNNAIQIINAFSVTTDGELRSAVLKRIKALVQLEVQAAALLERAGIAFSPFLAHCENEDVAGSTQGRKAAVTEPAAGDDDNAAAAAAAEPAAKKAKKAKKGKAKAAAAAAAGGDGSNAGTPLPEGEREDDDAAEDKAETTAARPAVGSAGLDHARFKLYLRELEMDVFQVWMRLKCSCRALLDLSRPGQRAQCSCLFRVCAGCPHTAWS